MFASPPVRPDQMSSPTSIKATNPTSARRPFLEMSRPLRREFCLYLIARSSFNQRRVQRQFHAKRVEKYYVPGCVYSSCSVIADANIRAPQLPGGVGASGARDVRQQNGRQHRDAMTQTISTRVNPGSAFLPLVTLAVEMSAAAPVPPSCPSAP